MGQGVLVILFLCTCALFAGKSSAQVAANATGINGTIFPEVQATNFALLGNLRANNFTGAARYLAQDLQLFVANQTGPLTLASNATAVASTLSIVSDPNATITFSERIFQQVNNYTAAFADVFNAGQPGVNFFYTAVWQKESDLNWYLRFASIAPASNATVTTRTLPYIYATPANATRNSSQPYLNATFLANFTTQPAVGGTASKLLADLGNASLSNANITDKYFAPYFQLVLPGTDGPVPLNNTDPTFSGFLSSLRLHNATAPAPLGVSYLQLSPEAALLTSLVRDVLVFGNVYVIMLWEFLDGTSWRLSLASLNIAPPS
jgi:hypothetical protein